MVRPRDNREIIARIQANLPPEVLVIDDYLCVDMAGSQVFIRRGKNWQEVHLQRLEFELLKVLIMNAVWLCSQPVLKGKIWEDKIVSDDVLASNSPATREN